MFVAPCVHHADNGDERFAKRCQKIFRFHRNRIVYYAAHDPDGFQFAELLHQYAPYIIGRMGVPYHARGVNIISVAVDAPADAISALSGKIGRLAGITAKTVYAPEDALQQGK